MVPFDKVTVEQIIKINENEFFVVKKVEANVQLVKNDEELVKGSQSALDKIRRCRNDVCDLKSKQDYDKVLKLNIAVR